MTDTVKKLIAAIWLLGAIVHALSAIVWVWAWSAGLDLPDYPYWRRISDDAAMVIASLFVWAAFRPVRGL